VPLSGLSSTREQLPPTTETKVGDAAAPVEVSKEVARIDPEPMKKAEAPAQSLPYSPPPPGEAQSGGRSQSQTQAGNTTQGIGGGFKVQSAEKSQSKDRERDAAKDARLDEMNRQNQAILAQKRGADDKQKGGPSRNMDNVNLNNRSMNEVRNEPARKGDGAAASGEEAPETRSVGGRKFVRQGNRWVDQKFKSSMSIKNVARGSDDFAELDSSLRSIAQQLAGELMIVWKGKAYLIR